MPTVNSIPCIKGKRDFDYLVMSINASIFPQIFKNLPEITR